MTDVDRRLRVVEAIRLNWSIPQIADELSMTVKDVRTIVDEAHAEMHSRYIEGAAKIQMISIARLEHMYSIAETWATGNGVWYEKNSEGDEVEFKQVMPDRMWMKQAVEIVKTEMDIATKALNGNGKEDDKAPTTNINQMIIQQTLIAGDELYETARQSMEEEWLLEEQEVQWADLDGTDLITLNEEMVTDPRIEALEKEMGKLIPGEEPDNENDDGS